jgi:thiamine pyrophosphate-dependent acetolactate synthase large subunit-like protein
MSKVQPMRQMLIQEQQIKLEFVLLSGPGATNLVTEIAMRMDSIQWIIITGQVGRTFIGTDAFQEIFLELLTYRETFLHSS